MNIGMCLINSAGAAEPPRQSVEVSGRRRFTAAPMAVLAAYATGFGGLFTVVGEIAAGRLAAFLAGLRGTFRVVLEIAPDIWPPL